MKQAATLFLPLALLIPVLCVMQFMPEKSPENPQLFAQQDLPHEISAESLYQLMAAEIALDRGVPEVALANYIAAAQETQDPQVAARATQIALTVASLEAALQPALLWAKYDPKNSEAQITTAAIYIRLNQIQNAVPFLQRSEQLNPEEAFQYFLLLYRQLATADESNRVIQALELLTKEETHIISAHCALAEIYSAQNALSQALTLSAQALNIQPESVIAIQLHTQNLLNTQGKDAAKTFLEKTVKTYPENTTLQSYFAQFLLENGYSLQAKKAIEALITKPNISPEILIQFAKQCLQAQWYPLAEKILTLSSKIPAQKDLSYYLMARSADMQNNPKSALEWYKQVLTGPFHAVSQMRASNLLSKQGRYTEALSLLSRTQSSDDNETKQLTLAKVDILNKTKQYEQAFDLLGDALSDMPEDNDLLYAHSLIADKLDALKIAETDLKTILMNKPDHIDALNALGYLLSNRMTRYEEALTYLSKAQALAPNNASVLDSLGWLYYKMGQYEKSIALLKQAVAILPDAEISAHLKEVLRQTKGF